MPPKFSLELQNPFVSTAGLTRQARTSPCEEACPAGNPIQKMHALIQSGQPEEALAFLRARNPFPGVTGHICPRFCEESCNRINYDQAVAIKALERFAATGSDQSRLARPKRMAPSGKKLAVVGAGPAGMTCAYFAALLGHAVSLYESAAVLGGMPRSGVPDFRLPKSLVDMEIGQILETGIQVFGNTRVGVDVTFEELLADYDACLISTGAWKEKLPDLEGIGSARSGLSFLKEINLGLAPETASPVAVIGGGGVAFDCAIAALKQGAQEVHLFCVEQEDSLCAYPDDVREAKEAGVVIHCASSITRISAESGKPRAIEYRGVSSFEFDACGLLTLSHSPDPPLTMQVGQVIAAVGMEPDLGFLRGNASLRFTPKGALQIDPHTMMSALPGVFGAGDAVSGPSSVAQAIGSGRRAALCIDAYLRQQSEDADLIEVSLDEDDASVRRETGQAHAPHVVAFEEIMNVDAHQKSQNALQAAGGHTGPAQATGRGISLQAAQAEAERCFHCGHCTMCGRCVRNCPGFVLEMTSQGPRVEHFDECWHCGCCRIACPGGAVYYDFPLNMMV